MKKILALSIYLLFHVYILRAVRTEIFSLQLNTKFQAKVENTSTVSILNLDARKVLFEYSSDSSKKILSYKVSFGYFFLFSIFGLILIGAGKQFFILIALIHFSDLVISSIVLKSAYLFSFKTLVICDLFSAYLIPSASIAIIPLAIMYRNNDHK